MREPFTIPNCQEAAQCGIYKTVRQPNLGHLALAFGLEPNSIFPTGPEALRESILHYNINEGILLV